MAVMKTHISWTDSTWNPTVGCTKVSPGCDNCYAEAIAIRLMGGFDLRLHPDRIKQVSGFRPIRDKAGLRPRMVFVNSMSDLFHKDIPENFLNRVFDEIDAKVDTVFQILTKRTAGMRRYVERRYTDNVPSHIWLGTSIENNQVGGRVRILRSMKDHFSGDVVTFLSVEPLIGPVDDIEFDDIDWVIIGGESGARCRPMRPEWAYDTISRAKAAAACVWAKQWGHPRNNPLVIDEMKASGSSAHAAFKKVCATGMEKAPNEKGGATFNGLLWHELPPAFYDIRRMLDEKGSPRKASQRPLPMV